LYLKDFDCVTAGPRGIFVINTKDSSYGIISNCGAYTKIGQLPTQYSKYYGYVFTQDDKGQLHLIDNQGHYYTQIAQCG